MHGFLKEVHFICGRVFFRGEVCTAQGNLGRINTASIMWVFFSSQSLASWSLLLKSVLQEQEASLRSPPLLSRLPLHASQQSGIWHITCQPPTGIFAEPTVHIEPNHTSCKRFTIPLSSSGQKSGGRWRRRRRTHLMVGKRAEGNGNNGVTKSWGRWSSYSSALSPLPDTWNDNAVGLRKNWGNSGAVGGRECINDSLPSGWVADRAGTLSRL